MKRVIALFIVFLLLPISANALVKEAYEKGDVKVKGVGLTNSFKLKVFQWFSKYRR